MDLLLDLTIVFLLEKLYTAKLLIKFFIETSCELPLREPVDSDDQVPLLAMRENFREKLESQQNSSGIYKVSSSKSFPPKKTFGRRNFLFQKKKALWHSNARSASLTFSAMS